MNKVIIHRNRENGSIRRAYLLPEKVTIPEMCEKLSQFNAHDDHEIATHEEVPDALVDVITFLIKNRQIDVNSNIEELRDLKRDISDIRDSIDESIDRLERRVKEQGKQ